MRLFSDDDKRIYEVTVARCPQTYIEGNRPVINGVRVRRRLEVAEMLQSDSADAAERLLEALTGSDKYPDRASNEVRCGHPWQFNDEEETGPVQSIKIRPAAPARRRLI